MEHTTKVSQKCATHVHNGLENMASKIQLTKLIKITVTWRFVGSCRPTISLEDGAFSTLGGLNGFTLNTVKPLETTAGNYGECCRLLNACSIQHLLMAGK